MYGPLNLGMSEQDAKKFAIDSLELVGITEEYYQMSPIELSGGQKRCVAIAGVLAMKEGEVTRLSVDLFRSRRLKLEEMLLANEQQISEKERAIANLLGRLPFKVKRVSFETACSNEV